MLKTEARIADDAEVAAKLKAVFSFGPGKIIEEVLHRRLRVVVIENGLVKAVEDVPILVCVPQDADALAGKSPVKGVDGGGAEDRRVSDNEPFAVIGHGLFRCRSWQEGILRIEHILQIATPE